MSPCVSSLTYRKATLSRLVTGKFVTRTSLSDEYSKNLRFFTIGTENTPCADFWCQLCPGGVDGTTWAQLPDNKGYPVEIIVAA